MITKIDFKIKLKLVIIKTIYLKARKMEYWMLDVGQINIECIMLVIYQYGKI